MNNIKHLAQIVAVLSIAACSSTHRLSSEHRAMLGDIGTADVAECQTQCFQRVKRVLDAQSSFAYYRPHEVSRFTDQIQSCTLSCYKQPTEWDILIDHLKAEANR